MGEHSRLRPASPADLAELVALERDAFSDPWTAEQVGDTLSHPATLGLVLEGESGEIVGYLLGRLVIDEAEILTLGVRSSHRRQGFGRHLLEQALALMTDRGVRTVWLEVRISNGGAQALYAAAGFVASGVRRGYYRRPAEDALVLRRDLAGPASV